MPKLDSKTRSLRVRRIEDAALKLFKKRGYHGVGMREVAKATGVSLGNIYNYFESKEPLFDSILQRLYTDFIAEGQSPLDQLIRERRFPEDLEQFGQAIGKMVKSHRDYFILIYIDIAEFGGKHARPHYMDMAKRFEVILKEDFEELRAKRVLPEGVDPSVALTAIYMQFFNYFLVEQLIGAKGHMGLSDEKAIHAISELFRKGLKRDK